MSTRYNFEDAVRLRTKEVQVGDATVKVREPSAADIQFATQDDNEMFDARLVVRCLIDDGGQRLYEDDDAPSLYGGMAAAPLGQVALAIFNLVKREDAAGNGSSETDGATSPSASPSSSA